MMADSASGRLHFTMQTITSALSLIKGGRMRALAVTNLDRSKTFPDMPTLNEGVLPRFEMGAWYGLMAPSRYPGDIVKRLESEVGNAMKSAEFGATLAQAGADLRWMSAVDYGSYLHSENLRASVRWSRHQESSRLARTMADRQLQRHG